MCYNIFTMDRGKFSKRLSNLSKVACKELILSAGLKNREERILISWYVKEHTIYQIAKSEHLQKESAYNALAQARNRLYDILLWQDRFLPEKVQNIIRFLFQDA